jgi:mannose-6-phosphate isomerase-like protein (cupin superfamily)
MDTLRFRLTLTLALFSIVANAVSAQSFMECANIELDSERLTCYDAAADAIKASLEKPQVGSSQQRQEQRNAEVAAIVFGEEAALEIVEEVPEQITFIIKDVLYTQRRDTIFVAEDGRLFTKVSDTQVTIKPGERVAIEDGFFGAIFLVTEKGVRIKVKAR